MTTIPTDGRYRLKSGPFAGFSIAEAYKVKTPQALDLGYRYGDGRAFVYWLTTGDNPNSYVRDRAAAYFLRLGTDAWLGAAEAAAAT